MSWAYAGALCFSLLGMAILDFRHGLFWGAALRSKSGRVWARTAGVHFGVWAVFLLWDILGIELDVFFRGDSPYMTGINLAGKRVRRDVHASQRLLPHTRSTSCVERPQAHSHWTVAADGSSAHCPDGHLRQHHDRCWTVLLFAGNIVGHHDWAHADRRPFLHGLRGARPAGTLGSPAPAENRPSRPWRRQ